MNEFYSNDAFPTSLFIFSWFMGSHVLRSVCRPERGKFTIKSEPPLAFQSHRAFIKGQNNHIVIRLLRCTTKVNNFSAVSSFKRALSYIIRWKGNYFS